MIGQSTTFRLKYLDTNKLNIHGLHLMNPTDFGEPLSFLPAPQ